VGNFNNEATVKQDLIQFPSEPPQNPNGIARIWISNGGGGFTQWGFGPGYDLRQGRWRVADIDGDMWKTSDLIHLCCAASAKFWLSQGNSNWTPIDFAPWPGYGVQQGTWRVGNFNGDPSGRADLMHLCCSDYGHAWISNGGGSFVFPPPIFQPGVGYAMQSGRWR
jgi:hypothetical protein